MKKTGVTSFYYNQYCMIKVVTGGSLTRNEECFVLKQKCYKQELLLLLFFLF